MSDNNEILRRYAEEFRELVNARVDQGAGPPADLLRLNDHRDWNFVCVAMDVIEDACLAIKNFLDFSLDGPTKYENTGERYLRLYGLLNAVYIQQQALVELYKIMGCHSPSDVSNEFRKLRITEVRHQLASHGVNYQNPASRNKQAFVPVRFGLSGYRCSISENRGDTLEEVELDKELDAHCLQSIEVLERIYEKSVRTLFRGMPDRIEYFQSVLSDLAALKRGEIFELPSSSQRGVRIKLAKAVAKENGI
jgi:hypothetical protein